jgi:FRG domain-containing protein
MAKPTKRTGQTQPSIRAAWNEFLDQVARARKSLGDPKTIWYRGHTNAAWQLIPSLLRDPRVASKERFLFNEYSRYSTRLVGQKRNEWELLFDMQHYGIPTRLLDWSESLGVAVAFTVLQRYGEVSDSAVYVLDPVRLNEKSGIEGIKRVDDDQAFSYREVYWNHRPFAPEYPIAIDPPFQNERMYAQRGTFTVHGRNTEPLEHQRPREVRRVVLPRAALGGATEFLEHGGFNEFSIYPDLFGMARHLGRLVRAE